MTAAKQAKLQAAIAATLEELGEEFAQWAPVVTFSAPDPEPVALEAALDLWVP